MTSPRNERLPLDYGQVDAQWLTRTLQSAYPGVEVKAMEEVEFIPGHTTKARVRLDLNQAGIDAGLPEQVCLKANWFIVLEDLIPLGGEFGASDRPIDVDDMAKSLEGMAMMHGRSWGHPELDRQDWLQTALAPETTTDDYWMMMPDIFDEHNSLPERLAIFPRWMAEDPKRLYSAFLQLREHESADKGPRCLLHGDAHLGNSYRRPDGTRIWFDWQIVRKGLPWRDLTYFLVGSLKVEDRRASDRDLIRHYLEHLAANGGPRFDFEKAWEEVSRMVVWGLVAWQSNINPQQDTMSSLERFCCAANDMETHRFYRFT